MEATTLINIAHLTQKDNNRILLNDISLTVPEKTLLGILCETPTESAALLEAIAGVHSFTEGEITVCGYDIKKDREKVQLLIGYMPEEMPFYTDMTVMEYLSFITEAKQLSYEKAQINIKNTLSKTRLLGVRNALVSKLNAEGKARLGIAQAMVSSPSVLLLNNPTKNLNKKETGEIHGLIKSVSKSRTVIIISDNPDIFSFCDTVAVLSLGQLDFNTEKFIKGEKK